MRTLTSTPHSIRLQSSGARFLTGAALLILLITSPVVAQPPHGHAPSAATPSNVTASPAASNDIGWTMEAIRPELREAVRASLPADLATYQITAALETKGDTGHVVRGQLALDYVNTTGEPISMLPFRLYANGAADNHDAIRVDNVEVDGAGVEPSLTVENSVLSVPFGESLPGGESVTIELDFTANVPTDSREHYGIFGFDSDTTTWALAHWYPVVAGIDPSSGWMLDPPSDNGDPIFADTALYDVTITAPEVMRIVTTGVASGDDLPAPDGMRTQRFVSGPVRDFTVVADDDFEVVTREVNGITVNSWYNPGEEEAGAAVAAYGERSIAIFDDELGQFPYREIDFMPVNMSGAAGCEFPALIYVGQSYYDGDLSETDRLSLEFTVAHEVVHQWFYGLVGNNQYAHAFIDEGLTNYLSASVYFEHAYDEAIAGDVLDTFIRSQYERAVAGGDDPIVNLPTDDHERGQDYVIAAYAKAPLGFEAIREEIGDEAFLAALEAYVAEFSYEVAEPDDLIAAFEQASGQELDALWSFWFSEQNGTDEFEN